MKILCGCTSTQVVARGLLLLHLHRRTKCLTFHELGKTNYHLLLLLQAPGNAGEDIVGLSGRGNDHTWYLGAGGQLGVELCRWVLAAAPPTPPGGQVETSWSCVGSAWPGGLVGAMVPHLINGDYRLDLTGFHETREISQYLLTACCTRTAPSGTQQAPTSGVRIMALRLPRNYMPQTVNCVLRPATYNSPTTPAGAGRNHSSRMEQCRGRDRRADAPHRPRAVAYVCIHVVVW